MYIKDLKLLALISISLIFLALNSIFAKYALFNQYTDAYTFTFLRLLFASITLITIFYFKNKHISFSLKHGNIGGLMLFIYAICFSYSYLSIDAGFGALLLFAVVQIFLFASASFYQERVSFQKVFGLLIAFAGLIYLLYPKSEFEISYFHSLLMIFSGLAWAGYTLLAKKSTKALENNTHSFIKATLIAVLFYFFINDELIYTKEGVFIAFLSGSITSALGYVLWYEVVKRVELITSSIIQLLVPIIAIFLSINFLNETLSFEMVLSAILICTGILVVIKTKVN